MAQNNDTAAAQAKEAVTPKVLTITLSDLRYKQLRREVVRANFNELETLPAMKKEARIETLCNDWIADKVMKAAEATDKNIERKRREVALEMAKEQGISFEAAYEQRFGGKPF